MSDSASRFPPGCAGWWWPRWPARSSSGTSSSSTAPPPRWCSARCSSTRATAISATILAAFVTYAVGFLARPLGGVVFGHFGDKYGRKKLLQFSLLLVGAATFLMGCLPTFGPDRLLGTRAAGGAALPAGLRGRRGMGRRGAVRGRAQPESRNADSGPAGRRPVCPSGNMLATVVLLVLTGTLSDAAFLSWGWRVAFWLSAVVVLVGYYIRTKVTDAPIFVAAQQEAERIKATSFSVVEVLKRYPRGVFTAMGLRFGENIMYYLVVTFSITYLKVQVGADTSSILWYLLVAHAVHFAVIPLVGRLLGSLRPAPGVLRRRGPRRHLGLLRLPDDEQRQLRDHHRRDHARPDVPRLHVRTAAGDHGRDVPDQDALFRCVPWLSGHLDRGRLAGADHRGEVARRLRLLGAGRAVSGGACAVTLVAVSVHPGDQGHRSQGTRRGRRRRVAKAERKAFA